jgi:hypothetical protein
MSEMRAKNSVGDSTAPCLIPCTISSVGVCGCGGCGGVGGVGVWGCGGVVGVVGVEVWGLGGDFPLRSNIPRSALCATLDTYNFTYDAFYYDASFR